MKKHYMHEVLGLLYLIVILLIPTTWGIGGLILSVLFLLQVVGHMYLSLRWYIKDKESLA